MRCVRLGYVVPKICPMLQEQTTVKFFAITLSKLIDDRYAHIRRLHRRTIELRNGRLLSKIVTW